MSNCKIILQKKALLILMIPSICICFFYRYSQIIYGPREIYTWNTTDYLVYSSKCRIPNVDPFNSEVNRFYHKENYVSCSKLDLLTYVTKNADNTEAYLYVDEHLIPSYSKNGVVCCLSNVTRGAQKPNNKTLDNTIHLSSCEDFDMNTTLPGIPFIVRCKNKKTKKEVYNNAYAPVLVKQNLKQRLDNYDRSTRPLSVLFVGLDSISRLNSMRAMPLTRGFLEENDWLEMQGYNKMGDNTYPNLMAVLTGKNKSAAYGDCDPTKQDGLNKCNILWKDYRESGYVTAYAEDCGPISTFNYNKKGFHEEPVDYYFRPYILSTEKLKTTAVDEITYCTGPESSVERILNTAKDFSITYKNEPNFGFFWMNFAHNKLNSATRLDFKLKKFLEAIKSEGVLDNSIVIFLSDHGLRFGKILYTYTGWLEERLPMFFIWVPQWFREQYALEYENMRINANRLTNPYDLHMTLKDILVYSGRNYTAKPAEGCTKCKSLFKDIEINRSCEDSSIDMHWCTCAGYKFVSEKELIVADAANFILDGIHKIIAGKKEGKKCAKYSLTRIVSARISNNTDNWYTNNKYLLIILETSPAGIFEGTVRADLTRGNFTLQDGISRLDRYGSHSRCVNDSYLKTLCYC